MSNIIETLVKWNILMETVGYNNQSIIGLLLKKPHTCLT